MRSKTDERQFRNETWDCPENAEPNSSATQCVFVTSSGKAAVSLETALNSIVHFSEAGKPIQEGGPVHIYFEDPVHHKQPITDVKEIEII